MFGKHTDVRPDEAGGHGRSLATKRLIELLSDIAKPHGSRLTDEVMSEHCGKDTRPGGDGYGNLGTAIRACEKDGIMWKREPGAGCIVKCDNERVMDAAGKARKHGKRTAGRALNQLRCADLNAMTPEGRTEYLAELAVAGTMVVAADNRTMKKLKARNVQSPIDPGRLLEAFKDGTQT